MNSATWLYLPFVFFLLYHTTYFDFNQLRWPLKLKSRFSLCTNLCRKQNICILNYKFFISRITSVFPESRLLFLEQSHHLLGKKKLLGEILEEHPTTMSFEHIYKKIYGIYSFTYSLLRIHAWAEKWIKKPICQIQISFSIEFKN